MAVALLGRVCALYFATDPTTPYCVSYPPCLANGKTLLDPFRHLGLWPRECLGRLCLHLNQLDPPAHSIPSHLPPDNTHIHTHTQVTNHGAVEPISPTADNVDKCLIRHVKKGRPSRGGEGKQHKHRWGGRNACAGQEHTRAEEAKVQWEMRQAGEFHVPAELAAGQPTWAHPSYSSVKTKTGSLQSCATRGTILVTAPRAFYHHVKC